METNNTILTNSKEDLLNMNKEQQIIENYQKNLFNSNDISFILWLLFCFLSVLPPLYGHYKMLRFR